MSRGLWLSGAGLAAGLLRTGMMSAALRNLPINGGPDPGIVGAVSLLLLTIALVASAVPALRAAWVNPIHALRQD